MKAKSHGRIYVRSLTILRNSPYYVIRTPYPRPSLFTAPKAAVPLPGLPTYKKAHTELKAKRVSRKAIWDKRSTPYSMTRPDHPPAKFHSADDVDFSKDPSPNVIVYECHSRCLNHRSLVHITASQYEDKIQANSLNDSLFQVEEPKIAHSKSACNTKTSKRSISVHHHGLQVDAQTCRMLKKRLLGEELMPFHLAWKTLCQIDSRALYKKKPVIRYEDIFPPTPELPPFDEAWKIISQMTDSIPHKSEIAKCPKLSLPIEPASDGLNDSLNKTNHNHNLPIDSEASKTSVLGALDSPIPKSEGLYHSGPRQISSSDDLQFGSQASTSTTLGNQGSHHRVNYGPRPQDSFPPPSAPKIPYYADIVYNDFFLTRKPLPSQYEQYLKFGVAPPPSPPPPPPPPKTFTPFFGDEANRILVILEQFRRVLTPLFYFIFSCIYGVLSYVGKFSAPRNLIFCAFSAAYTAFTR